MGESHRAGRLLKPLGLLLLLEEEAAAEALPLPQWKPQDSSSELTKPEPVTCRVLPPLLLQ